MYNVILPLKEGDRIYKIKKFNRSHTAINFSASNCYFEVTYDNCGYNIYERSCYLSYKIPWNKEFKITPNLERSEKIENIHNWLGGPI